MTLLPTERQVCRSRASRLETCECMGGIVMSPDLKWVAGLEEQVVGWAPGDLRIALGSARLQLQANRRQGQRECEEAGSARQRHCRTLDFCSAKISGTKTTVDRQPQLVRIPGRAGIPAHGRIGLGVHFSAQDWRGCTRGWGKRGRHTQAPLLRVLQGIAL